MGHLAVYPADLQPKSSWGVIVKTQTAQAGSGMPSPSNIRALSGKANIALSVNGVTVNLVPQSTLHGLSGAEDEIASSGAEEHNTAAISLTGLESGWGSAGTTVKTATIKITHYSLLSGGLDIAAIKSLCSHFDTTAISGDTDTEHVRTAGVGFAETMVFYVNKTRLGWYEGMTAAEIRTAMQTWLAAQNTAGTPVQVVYRLAAPATASNIAVPILGASVATEDGELIGTVVAEGWDRAQFHSGLGRLPDARESRTHRAVNGDWSFTMLYPLNGMNASEIVQDRLICAESQLYRINGIQKEDVSSGRMLRVDAEHIFYDLRDSEIVNIETAENPDTENGVTQEAALGLILAGTPFSVGTVNTGSALDHLDILQKSPYWALKEQVLALWGGELFPDNWTIHILAQCGLDRKFPIRRGRNLRGIKYKESVKEMVTRLHVTGYEGATFEEINDGRDYIDSPNIDLYHAPKEGRVSFDDIDDPAELLAEAQAYLPTVDIPQVEYDLDLLFLKCSAFWSLYASLEECDLGDTVSIHHDFFALDIPARAMEAERDPVREFTVRVVIGNYTNKLFSTLSDAKSTTDIVSLFTNTNGTVKASRLRGMIDLLTTQLKSSGSYANATVLEDQGFLIENTNLSSPDYGAMYLGCGIFAIAGEKNEDNSWRWSTFGTPRGFTGQMILAESITANKLAADVANSLELSSNASILAVVSAAIDAESNALKAYAQELLTNHDWTVEISQAQAAAIEISDTELETFKSWVKGWMSYDGTTLSLGKSDSDYATAITNTQMAFTYKGTTLAYFSNGRLYVPWAEFEKVTMTQKSSTGVVEGYLDIALEDGSYYGAWRDA